tara:strand:+ start:1464 stop:2390 length:927 start_codon:yes stop_codon:yes gene_type:complete
MKKIKILLIGSGNIARQHYKAFSEFKEFIFVGVVARNKKKLKKFSLELNIPYFSDNIDLAHRTTSPDLVIVATTIESTLKVCLKLLKFKSVLFVEKPLGYNFSETKVLCNKFFKYKKKVFIALNRRHYTSTRIVQKDLIKENKKRTLIVQDQSNLKNHFNKFPKKIVNNFMYANSIHLIDYFNIFCRGNLTRIRTFNSFNKKPYFVKSELLFSSGDIGIYSAIYNNESPWNISLITGKKIYIFKPLEAISSNFNLKKYKFKFADDKNFKPGFKLQAREVLNFFLGSKHQLPDYKQYLISCKLIKKIYK